MSTLINIFQLIGGFILAIGYAPQIIKMVKTKSGKGLNPVWLSMMALGIGLMEVYAVYNIKVATMFFITNTSSLVLSSTVLILYIIYNRREKQ